MTLSEIREWYEANQSRYVTDEKAMMVRMIGLLLSRTGELEADLSFFKREASMYAKDYSDAIERIDSLTCECCNRKCEGERNALSRLTDGRFSK
jgi:hypothetical protein